MNSLGVLDLSWSKGVINYDLFDLRVVLNRGQGNVIGGPLWN